MRPERFLRVATSVIVAVLVVLPTTAAFAQVRLHPVLSDFQPTGDYALVVAGTDVDDAQIYLSRRAAAILIVAARLPSPILLWGGSSRVDSVPAASMVAGEGGGLGVLDNVSRTYLGSFRIEETELIFTVDGREARLRAQPPLIGPQSLARLFDRSPEYVRKASAYRPDPGMIEELQQQSEPVRVLVFFGSWCAACKEYLPHGLKVEEALAGSRIRFEYFGLPLPPAAWEDPEVKRLGVKGLPTAIVYVGEEETGRFIGTNGFQRPEDSLSKILRVPGTTVGGG